MFPQNCHISMRFCPFSTNSTDSETSRKCVDVRLDAVYPKLFLVSNKRLQCRQMTHFSSKLFFQLSQLSWLERGSNKPKVVGSIPTESILLLLSLPFLFPLHYGRRICSSTNFFVTVHCLNNQNHLKKVVAVYKLETTYHLFFSVVI